jgi:hypothetical protein
MTQEASPATIAVEDWRLVALDHRRAGKNFRTIAKDLAAAGGPSSVSRAHELVIEALADLREKCREAATDIRDIEIQRCDAMIEALWPKINRARVVDTILRIMDRKARYLGLDAPKRIEASGANGAPLLPPGSITIALIKPGETIPVVPATNPAPGATEPPIDATNPPVRETSADLPPG